MHFIYIIYINLLKELTPYNYKRYQFLSLTKVLVVNNVCLTINHIIVHIDVSFNLNANVVSIKNSFFFFFIISNTFNFYINFRKINFYTIVLIPMF